MLIDNAVGQLASSLHIFSARVENAVKYVGPLSHVDSMLCFADDGKGFSLDEARAVICARRSSTLSQAHHQSVTQYGNRLCMGAMRVGGDTLLFTKHSSSRSSTDATATATPTVRTVSCILMSQTLHNYTPSDRPPLAPIAQWTYKGGVYKPVGSLQDHRANVLAILRFSPFNSSAELLAQFRHIATEQGNLVVCYSLWRVQKITNTKAKVPMGRTPLLLCYVSFLKSSALRLFSLPGRWLAPSA